MDIISRKYINEGFNSKAYIINDDYILLDGVNQNSYKNYQKYVNVINQISNVKSLEIPRIIELIEPCEEYPIPYELHGSRDWIERYKEDKTIVINDDYKVDPDLASHFNVINVPNDKMDFGKPSKEVFSKVPKEYIIDSNYSDTLDCVEEIVNNPVYCILNLCRFYALIRDDLTLSKYDGGKWALENMNSNYNDVIKNAMEDYLSDTNNSYDNTRLKEFAQEAISLINDCVDTNKIRK